MVRMIVEYAISVPESFSPEDIEAQRNGGSWCSDNALNELDLAFGEECACDSMRFEFIGDATEEQDKRYGLARLAAAE